MIQYRTDNDILIDNNGKRGRTVWIDWTEDRLSLELKKFFGWRSATKNYSSIKQRYCQESSYNYDSFLAYVLKCYPSSVTLK